MTHISKAILKLGLVTSMQGYSQEQYREFILQSVRGGVTMVQLREKTSDMDQVINKGLFLRKVLKPLGIPLIINDFVDIAKTIDADGVHIGQHDMDVKEARKILGAEKLIGVSIESFSGLHKANDTAEISYVSASAIYQSNTKDCKKIWGIDNFRKLVQLSRHPIIAIGGINVDNAREVFEAGSDGIAVVSALHDSPDPYHAARALSNCMCHNQSTY